MVRTDMSLLAIFTSPWMFTAVMTVALTALLHISIRNEGWHPPFRQVRVRRALVITLLTWALSVLANAWHT
jgi:hypothetical protein